MADFTGMREPKRYPATQDKLTIDPQDDAIRSFYFGLSDEDKENVLSGLDDEETSLVNEAFKEKYYEEMHPSMSNIDRAIVKNFSNDPAAAVGYLQYENPKMDYTVNEEGRIYGRRKNEYDWRALDPDTGIDLSSMRGFKELLKDTGDVAWDVGAGTVETMASTAAGLAGAAPGAAILNPMAAGAGGLAAASAAGGASAAGLEYWRQRLGKQIGVNKEYDPSQIKVAGGIGLLAPFFMGAGAGMKQAERYGAKKFGEGLGKKGLSVADTPLMGASEGAGKVALKEGATRIPEQAQVLFNAQRGLPSKALSLIPEKATSFLTRTPIQAVRAAKKYWPEMRKLEKDVDFNIPELAAEARDQLVPRIQEARRTLYGEIDGLLKEADTTVDLTDVKEPFNELRGRLLALRKDEKVFSRMREQDQDAITKLYTDLFETRKTAESYDIIGTSKDISGPRPEIKKGGSVTFYDEIESASPSEAMFLRDDLRGLTKLGKNVPEKYKGLSNHESGISVAASKAYAILTRKIDDAVDSAASTKAKAGLTGFRNTKQLRGKYKQLKDLERAIPEFYKDSPDAILRGLTNLSKHPDKRLKLLQFDAEHGTDIIPTSDILNAYRYFGKDVGSALMRQALGLGTGGAIGYYAGGKRGALIGAALTSKPAMRQFIRMSRAAAKLRNMAQEPYGLGLKLPQIGGTAAALSTMKEK